MKVIRHIVIISLSLFILLGIPLYKSGYFRRDSGDVDAVSSATMILDTPSGEYLVVINADYHTDKGKLDTWKKFFSGDEIDYIFEDISCVVASTDEAGIDFAESFRSRLPENQMTIRREDITLMLSKAINDRFDVMVLSKEIAAVYDVEELFSAKNTVIIDSEGE